MRKCAGLFLIACSWALSSLQTVWPWNGFVLVHTWSLEIKNSQGQVIWISKMFKSCALPRTWEAASCMLAHCLGEEGCKRELFFHISSPFLTLLRRVVKISFRTVTNLTFRHPANLNNPSDIKKGSSLVLICTCPFVLSFSWKTVYVLVLCFWAILKNRIHHNLLLS